MSEVVGGCSADIVPCVAEVNEETITVLGVAVLSVAQAYALFQCLDGTLALFGI